MLPLYRCLFWCMLSVLLDFSLDDFKDHHCCIKFGLKFRKTASETCEVLRVTFSDIAMERTLIFEWFFFGLWLWICRGRQWVFRLSLQRSYRCENVESLQKKSMETHTVPFWRWVVGYASCRTCHLVSEVELWTFDISLHSLCRSLAWVCVSGTVKWSDK